LANTTHSRRVVFSYLQNKEAIKELFGPIADKVGDRPGGYVRVIKLGFRRSDGAEMAMIEFVDYNEVYNPNEDKGEGGGGRRRRRRRRGGGGSESTAADTTTETAAEEEEETEEEEDAADDIVDEVEETTEEETTDDTEEEKDEEEK
jgi:large subunit ribosomal protein L17